MKKSPLVSVIIPCYNHEKFVTETIESITKQSYKNIELIVIDDGSKDNSAVLLKSLSEKYNFYFEIQKNMGLVKTLNKLIGKCKGKYISIIASDDILLLTKVECQVQYMEENSDIGASFGNKILINEKNEILPWYFQRFSNYREVSFEDIISIDVALPAGANMIRKDVFDRLGRFDEQYSFEDFPYWAKIAYNKIKISILPDLMYYYRIHGNNMTKNMKAIYKEKLRMMKVYEKEKGYRKGVLKTHFFYYRYRLLNMFPKWLNPF